MGLNGYEHSPAFSELERDALRLTDAMCQTPVDVPDDVYDKVRAQLSPAQMVELTAAIAWENFRARFNRSHGIGSDGFSEGSFCVLPVRPKPSADVQAEQHVQG